MTTRKRFEPGQAVGVRASRDDKENTTTLIIEPPLATTMRFPVPRNQCEHEWEPHLWEHGRAYCARCGTFAKWATDPRLAQEKP